MGYEADLKLFIDGSWRAGEDLAIFTSGKTDFATNRLMQGFGLTVA
mgnify:CR=1 FL=1